MRGVSRQSRRLKAVTAAATATALIALSGTFAGCTPSNSTGPLVQVAPPPASGSVLGDEETNFEGRLLQVAIKGLITGASEQAGGDAYGNILSLLGWGGDADTGHYKEMQDKLDDIGKGIAEIKSELADLQSQVKITQDKIIGNGNDPAAAITEITTYNDELQGLSESVTTPGAGDKAAILAFAEKVEDDYRIENDVNLIGAAMIPPTTAKDPVLDNYTHLLTLQMQGNKLDLPTAYSALETYFIQLLYYQLQGVTLVVEAKTAIAKAGGNPVGTSAEAYYTRFRTRQLAPQVQNFMYNTWRLIVDRGSLAHTSGFLPADAKGIASRAEFLRTQTLAMDHFGLRAHAVVTSNHKDELSAATATASDGAVHAAKATATTTVPGPIYDSWKGSKVSPSTEYQVVTFDFGDVPVGTYSITGPAGFAPAAVKVQSYTADYAADTAGKIHYGCGLGHTRVGAQEAFAAGAGGAGRTWKHGGASNVSFSGSLASDSISVSGHETNDEFTGEIQVDYRFTYAGSTPADVTIPTPAHAHGNAVTAVEVDMDGSGSADATVTATMGVWDSTSSKIVSAANKWSKEVSYKQSASADWRPKNSAFGFRAVPGHSYTVYFTVSVSGSAHDGSSTAKLTIDSMKGMQIKF